MRMATCLMAWMLASVGWSAEGKAVYPPLPESFSSFGAAVSDGFVYVYGGHVAKTHVYSTEAVTGKFRRLRLADPAKGWEELPAGPPLQGLALVAHAGKIYRIGGMHPRNKPDEKADNHSVASCDVFDPKTKQWQALPDLPAARSSHDAVVVGDQLLVVGGWNLKGRGNGYHYDEHALVLDLSQKKLHWDTIPQPFKRRALQTAVFDAKVYVFGGMDDENTIELAVDVLDPKTKKWSSAPAIPGARRNGFSPAACVSDGKLYLSPPNGIVYRLTEKKDRWEEVGALQKPRLVHRMVPAGENRLLVLGGASGPENIAAVEAIEPKVQPKKD